ncbi:chemotaxis protein CheW, partial [bacterium]
MAEDTSGERQYVVFRLGPETFGLDINKVKEIIIYQDTTRLPGAGRLIEGVINLRGHIIPIYALRKRFGFTAGTGAGITRIVVVEVRKSTVGIVVDGVSEVLMIPDSVMEKPSAIISAGVDANYISGIAKTDEGLIIILDLERVIESNIA